jgi:branched-chain amino acid transport system ATP-binding protein
VALLECRGVAVSYGGLTAVEEADIEVRSGTRVAILGPNGAGKTSLLRGIFGLETCARGSVWLDGREITNRPTSEIVRLGMALVPDGRQLFPNLPVQKNLWVGAYLRTKSRAERAAVRDDLDGVYEMFPALRDRARQRAGSLSGGEQRMLAIGRALMGKPRVLVLDEPSLGLAPVILKGIFDALDRMVTESGVTLLLVEQNVELATGVVDEVYVLEAGRVVDRGPTESFRGGDLAKLYLGS